MSMARFVDSLVRFVLRIIDSLVNALGLNKNEVELVEKQPNAGLDKNEVEVELVDEVEVEKQPNVGLDKNEVESVDEVEPNALDENRAAQACSASNLILLFHADPGIRARYKSAFKRVGLSNYDFIIVNAGNGSLVYRRFVLDLGNRNRLRNVVRKASGRDLGAYQTVTLASFSAGYGAIEEILKERESAMLVNGICLLDSGYASRDSDGTASDTQMAPWVAMATRAINEEAVFFHGYTDVPTYTYASTKDVAENVMALCEVTAEPIVKPVGVAESGRDIDAVTIEKGLATWAYVDAYDSGASEHGAALTQWGDDALASVAHAVSMLGPCVVPPRPVIDAPLGVLCIAVGRGMLGVTEIPGPAHNDMILEFLSVCERDGKRIGQWLRTDETPWCAAFVSWCLIRASRFISLSREQWPHLPRAAVRECWTDAISRGTAVAAPRIRSGEVELYPGDELVFTRGGAGATRYDAGAFSVTRGYGHISRYDHGPLDACVSLDGNVNDRVRLVDRDLAGDPAFIGAIVHPRPGESYPLLTDAELDALVAFTQAVAKDREGL